MYSEELKEYLLSTADTVLRTNTTLSLKETCELDLTEHGLEVLGNGYLLLYSFGVSDNSLLKLNELPVNELDDLNTPTLKRNLANIASPCAHYLKERIGKGEIGLDGEELSLYKLIMAFMILYKNYFKDLRPQTIQ